MSFALTIFFDILFRGRRLSGAKFWPSCLPKILAIERSRLMQLPSGFHAPLVHPAHLLHFHQEEAYVNTSLYCLPNTSHFREALINLEQ
jgi:hypothetical protein